MMANADSIARIINGQWGQITQKYNSYQIRTLNAIKRCRTSGLGGSLYHCKSCGHLHKRYHSCRNRHCPQCQNTQTQHWIEKQEEKLIHCNYYHVVFTFPHLLNEIFLTYPRSLYAQLMHSAWQTLNGFGWNHKFLGAQIGATMVLHTWGSNLSYHPHVHCIVPAGGITLKGKWKDAKGTNKFLFPVKALSKIFKSKMIEAIQHFMIEEGMELPSHLVNTLYKTPWVVYTKAPFGGAQGVIRYLARYTHKIAITNHRIINFDHSKVIFSYTDYRHRNQRKVMKLSSSEFIRRFVLHILPKGFCRIRHFGILSACWKRKIFLKHTKAKALPFDLWLKKGLDLFKCPKCKEGRLDFIRNINPVRGPPIYTQGL